MMTDKEAYTKISQSAWYAAWKAVEAWYPYRRKMKSFHLFVEAFENKDRRAAIKLCVRFKMRGSTVGAMIKEFDKLAGI